MSGKAIEIYLKTIATGDGLKKVAADYAQVAKAATSASAEATRAMKAAAKEQAAAAKQAANEAMAEAKRAAREQEEAAKQAASAVKKAEAEKANAAKQAADEATDAAKRATREQERFAKAAADAEIARGKGRANAVLEFSRLAEDAQYGIKGVLNNIPGLITALGGGPGLAGAAALTALAISQLWDKFHTGAEEAKNDTDEVKASTEALKTVMDAVREAQDQAYAKDLTDYLANIEAATEAWGRQKDAIADALEKSNALAASQMNLAKAQIEFERQQHLAGATTSAERDAINAGYDSRVKKLERQGQEEALIREYEAQLTLKNTLASRLKDAQADKSGLSQKMAEEDARRAAIQKQLGGKSDQERRIAETQQLTAERRALEEQLQGKLQVRSELEMQPFGDLATGYVNAQIKQLEEQLSKVVTRLDQRQATFTADVENKAAGKLTFEGLIGEQQGVMAEQFRNLVAELERLGAGRPKMEEELSSLEKAINNFSSQQREQAAAMERLLLEQNTKRTQMQTQDYQRMQEEARKAPQRDPLGQIIAPALPTPGNFPKGPGAVVPTLPYNLPWVPGGNPAQFLPVPGQTIPGGGYPIGPLPQVPGAPPAPQLPTPPIDTKPVEDAAQRAAAETAKGLEGIKNALQHIAALWEGAQKQIAMLQAQARNSNRTA